MSYHQFKDIEPYGSFEVFYDDARDDKGFYQTDEEGAAIAEGFYWWACWPGCLPDGDPIGPFETEQQAVNDARGGDNA